MRRVTQFFGVAVLVVLAAGPAAYAGGRWGGAGVSRTGPHGTTVQAGARGGAYVGPGGRAVAGGAHGVKVTGPEGNTYAHGGAGAVAAGPRGVAAAGARGTVWNGHARYYTAARVSSTPYPAGSYVPGVR